MSRLLQLSPAIALTAVVALVLAGIVMALYLDGSYRSQKAHEIGIDANILSAIVPAALSFKDRQAAREYVDALASNPEIQVAALYDANDRPFAVYARPGSAGAPASVKLTLPRFEGDKLIVATPVVQGGMHLGTVYLRARTEPLAHRLERYGIIAVLVAMGSLLVGILAAAHRALNRANAELKTRALDLAAANRSLQTQIAEREKIEDALRQAQKMEAIGQLTGGIAHDFNNLLQVILGNLDGLRRRVADRHDDTLRMVNAAIRGAERAARLTQRLLAFSRRQPLVPRPLDVNKLVAGMSDLLHRTLGEMTRIEVVLAAGAWRVSADANQLESALLNLAVNARDAMPAGGKMTIETGNAHFDEDYADQHEIAAGQYVMVAVTDTGIGMTREVHARAFEPFFTTKDVGQGTGLGLSQVYGFVKQSGGHVKIYSEPGEGTTVKLYLPRLAGEEVPAAGKAPPPAPPQGARDEIVLVVEDEPDVRALAVDTLRELGYGVLEAGDGPAALRTLEREPGIRLLFTDVGLPGGLNGRQLADEARSRLPELKVLFTTGYARNAIVHHGRLDPGVELIAKPFTHAALARKIRGLLDAGAESEGET